MLITLDGSPESERVLPEAVTLARALGAEVTLLQVVEPLMIYPVEAAALQTEELIDDQTREAGEYLERTAAGLRAGLTVETVVAFGTVAATIVEEAQKRGVALIAMATHGRSGLARTLVGSVADAVVRSAPCPVLLVRTGLAATPTPTVPEENRPAAQPESVVGEPASR
jgi:nucleotide-binding universal stress UspA family protein